MKNAILLHLYYQDYWPVFWQYLKEIKDKDLDIFVTVHNSDTEYYKDIQNNVNEVFLMENKGVDFGGFLYGYNKIKNNNYKTITKLHGKRRNLYRGKEGTKSAETWCEMLYLPLIEKEAYKILIKSFLHDDSLFLYGAKSCYIEEELDHPYFSQNKQAFEKINQILKLKPLNGSRFIAGSIFTASTYYLDLLFDNREMEIFEVMEPSVPFPNNGTIAHGLERFIGSHVNTFGGTFKVV